MKAKKHNYSLNVAIEEPPVRHVGKTGIVSIIPGADHLKKPDGDAEALLDKELHYQKAFRYPLLADSVSVCEGMWLDLQRKNHNISLPYAYRMFEEGGNFRNLRIAGGLEDAEYTCRLASDSDVYKWLEAVGYELAHHEDLELQAMAERVIDWIESAQDDNGYLMTYYQVYEPEKRWTDLANGHELYCAGHLFQAAVAYDSATNDGRLTKVALRLAEHIYSIFGSGKRQGTSGHPEIEMALADFYRFTDKRRYLELAKFFIDQRGLTPFGVRNESRYQNHVPVRMQRTVEGHAVRQLYLCAGIADLYLETGEELLIETLNAQWRDLVEKKIYITGGVGQRHEGEIIGEDYELPSGRCYCETCAAVASIFWNWRMLLATGESRFADLIERTLYNAFLSSYGYDGEHFFYVNPLQSRGPVEYQPGDQRGGWRRAHWHGTACCPPNVMRLLASLGHYIATHNQDEIQIQQYVSAEILHQLDGGMVKLKMDTEYPWRGNVSIKLDSSCDSEWTLVLRIPAWCRRYNIKVNGQNVSGEASGGYLRLKRMWGRGDVVELLFAIEPTWVEAHLRVDSVRGCVALQRGPLVYCFEQCDLGAGVLLDDIAIDTSATITERWRPDILDGVMTLELMGHQVDIHDWKNRLYRPYAGRTSRKSTPVKLMAIPYFAWSNRQPGAMRVWLHINSCVNEIQI